MSFTRYAILVLALVVLGLITVWGHLRLISAGYEMNDIRNRRDRLEEEARVLDRRIEALATPSNAAAQVRALDLGLVPPAQGRATGRGPLRPGTPLDRNGTPGTRLDSPRRARTGPGRRP